MHRFIFFLKKKFLVSAKHGDGSERRPQAAAAHRSLVEKKTKVKFLYAIKKYN